MKTKILIFSFFLTAQVFAGLGDLNGDGAINLEDCKLIAASVASGPELDLAVADIDGDGKVTILDAMRLHQSIGGLWVEPGGKIAPVPQVSEAERAYMARYEELCSRYKKMTPGDFLSGFEPAPLYSSTLDPAQCRYFPQIDSAFKLSDEQKAALRENGMVVIMRPSTYGSGFGGHYAEIYKKDLPVFFTTDALLDPLYKLYDEALKAVEVTMLAPALSTVLTATLEKIQSYRSINSSTDPLWNTALDDAEKYIYVASALLSGQNSNSVADYYLDLISAEKLANVPDFFGTEDVAIDFSQFKPRGHYDCLEWETDCVLPRYFKAMMWLGRADCAFNIDSLRHLRVFALIHSCMQLSGVMNEMVKINQTISSFVGDMDGFSLEGLTEVLSKRNMSIESIITSDDSAKALLNVIKSSGGANQLILSQALWKKPDASRPELPVIAQISGQRFILDSYMLGRTVEWYVKGRNKPMLEEVPFSLGNNAASTVLASDVNKYTVSQGDYKPYHARLGAARALFDKYPYWDRNLYTLWLNGLRALSQPLPATVPLLMQSRSWQEKQMNTQLSSWAQLRHNTLLYAKQSYTGGVICFYPDGYVEPYPQFYRIIGEMVNRLADMVKNVSNYDFKFDAKVWKMVTDSLASMAELELQGKPLTEAHIDFLNGMINEKPHEMCGDPPFNGWYPLLFKSWDDCRVARPCIADVHTIPPSEISPENMVLHAATGDASFIIIQAATANNCGTIYAGAVSSFYQHDEQPVLRLSDTEWITMLRKNDRDGIPEWFGKYIK
ncbi:MAG: DUF3160 domain-containing protein [Fibrobacter sp.]|nr:DUF3160 domain-containing protein [Fibrobacter sp.]